MDFDFKNAKFFSSKQEKARQQARQNRLDAKYGNPQYELQGMYVATRYGKIGFQLITLISTFAFLYRVTFSHAAELIGDVAAFSICATTALLCAIAVEKMLEGNHVPLWKKFFLTGKIDLVLATMALVFTSIVVAGAFSGMMVVGESANVAPIAETTTDIHRATQASIDRASNEIIKIQNCQVKGGYCYNGKLTPKGTARIDALTKEKAELLATMQSTNALTANVNETTKSAYEQKLAKAQQYLGRIAIAAELIKIMCFFFWGYRSRQLALYNQSFAHEEDEDDEDEIIDDETYDMYQEEEVGNSLPPTAGGANQIDPVYQANLKEHTSAMNYRRVLATRFSEHKRNGKHDIETLKGQWNRNEDRIARISAQLKQAYIRLPFPS